MAKKSMNMRVKSVKRERNKNKVEVKDEANFKSFMYTSVGVLAFIGVTYLGILGMEKLGVFDPGYVAPTKGEVTIDKTFINIGTIFNRDTETYYVLFDDYKNNYTQDVYVNYLIDAQKDIKVYKVDMSLEENQKYMSEEVNEKVQNVNELKINDITLMKVSKGKNVKYVIGSENIEEYLK